MTDEETPPTQRRGLGPVTGEPAPVEMDPVAQRVLDGIARVSAVGDECLRGLKSLATVVNAQFELQQMGPGKRGTSLSGTVVLFVDDEWQVLKALSNVVVHFGGVARVARTHEEADIALAQGDVHVAVIDLHLAGGKSGMTLAEKIAATHPEIGIVIFTGMIWEQECLAADAIQARVLDKPCTNNELVAAILGARKA